MQTHWLQKMTSLELPRAWNTRPLSPFCTERNWDPGFAQGHLVIQLNWNPGLQVPVQGLSTRAHAMHLGPPQVSGSCLSPRLWEELCHAAWAFPLPEATLQTWPFSEHLSKLPCLGLRLLPGEGIVEEVVITANILTSREHWAWSSKP